MPSTPDQNTAWQSDKHTIRHHKLEPRGQPFPHRLSQGNNHDVSLFETLLDSVSYEEKYPL